MKSEFEIYMETGMLGAYHPESAVGRREGDTIMPIYRDTTYWKTENGTELQREMLVGDRVFLIRSVLPFQAVASSGCLFMPSYSCHP